MLMLPQNVKKQSNMVKQGSQAQSSRIEGENEVVEVKNKDLSFSNIDKDIHVPIQNIIEESKAQKE